MTLLQKLAAITGLTMPVKELLRDVVIAVCACCRSGNSGGYTVAFTAIDEDAYGPTENVGVGVDVARYLSTTLGDIYLDRVRVSIPDLGNSEILINIRIGGVDLFEAPIAFQGTSTSGPGTMRFELEDFDPVFFSDPVADGSRIDVVTSQVAFGGFVNHKGLRVRLEGRVA